MPIIDSHVHLKHGDAERTEYTPEAIIEVMDAAGIERSVVFAMSTTTRRSMEMAAEAAGKFPERLIPYVYALPSYERPVLEELDEALGRMGFRGIKIHIGECRLTDYIIDPVLRLAAKYGVPCLVDFAGDLASAGRIARDFPDTRLIVAHLGKYLGTDVPQMDRFIALAEECPNVWLDCSGVVLSWKIADAARRVGAGRLLFGTDGPHPTPDLATYARLAVAQIRMLGLPLVDEEMILGGSIARLLRL